MSFLFWAEILIGAIFPLVFFSFKKIRQSPKGLFVGAVVVLLGMILNRFNVTLMNLMIRPGYTYFPSFGEIAVSVGLLCGGMIVIMLANKFLPVVKHDEGHEEKPAEAAVSS